VESSWQAIQEVNEGYSVTGLDGVLCRSVRIELNDSAERMIFIIRMEMAGLSVNVRAPHYPVSLMVS